jgi:hypothetical protein
MKISLRLSAFILIFFLFSSSAFGTVWSGLGSDNLASSALNWAGDAVPLFGDDVVFDNTSAKDCTWDLYKSVLSLAINGNYTGSISISSPLILSTFPGTAYDFNGILSNFFDIFTNGNHVDYAQIAEQLRYDSDGFNDQNVVVATARNFHPRYDQDWYATVTAGLPAFYNTNYNGCTLGNICPVGDSWMDVGLVVYFGDGSQNNFTTPLGMGTDSGTVVRKFAGEFNSAGIEYFDGVGNYYLGPDVTSAKMVITFDSKTKTLSATGNGQMFFQVNIQDPGSGAPGWGMQDSDTFGIAVYADSGNVSVNPAAPLTLNDFSIQMYSAP